VTRRGMAPLSLALLAGLGLLAACAGQPLTFQPRPSLDEQSLAPFRDHPYELGKAHLREGRIALALQAFRAELAANPGSVRALNALAVTYEQLGRIDLAEHYFDRALQIDPEAAQTLNNLGYSAFRRGDLARAVGYFERALRANGAHPTIQANMRLAGAQPSPPPAAPPALAAGAGMWVVPAAWVERTSPAVQTIVTRPDPAVLAAARRSAVEPHLFNVHWR
jgi:Flp pilus assembly protein TadD